MAVDTGTIEVVMPAMGESVVRGHRARVAQAGRRQRRRRRDPGRDLHRQGRRRGPSPASGTITKIHAAEGDTVTVGTLLAEISAGRRRRRPRAGDGNGTVTPAEAPPVSGESPPATVEEAAAGGATEAEGLAAAEQADGAQTIDIVTPTGGESVTEGTILEWAVKVGDAVKDGDTVVEISTDKVDMELPAPARRARSPRSSPRRGRPSPSAR